MSLMTMEIDLTHDEIDEAVREAEAILVRALFDDLVRTTDVARPSAAAVLAGDSRMPTPRPPRRDQAPGEVRASTVSRWARSPPRSPVS